MTLVTICCDDLENMRKKYYTGNADLGMRQWFLFMKSAVKFHRSMCSLVNALSLQEALKK